MNETPDNEPQQGLWQDTVDCWHRLPNKAFFFTLLAAWLALFQFFGNPILGYIHTPSLFQWMYDSYNDPGSNQGYGDLIPFLVIGLFWWKRKAMLAPPLGTWWPGLLILTAALALHAAGYMIQQPRLCAVALFAGIYALMGLAWGREWLCRSAFPFFFFAFSVPLTGLADSITFPLQQLVSWLTEKVAHVFLGIGVIRAGTQLFDPSGTYGFDVQAPCSGIRSLIAIFLLATVFGFLLFRSPWRRLLLMALAFPLSVLGNLTRMLLIIVAAEIGGQPWGMYVHEGCPIQLPLNLPLIGNEIAIVNLVPYVPAIAGLLIAGRLMEKYDEKKRA